LNEYFLHREQFIPRPIDEVFAFFADAANLETITPPWLNFHILPPLPAVLTTGSRIRYRLRWHGLSIRWLTEIHGWNPPTEFVDVQIRGPYLRWHHTHRFESADGGTRMRDSVRYALPLGLLGRMAHALVVGRNLQAIFDYRAGKIESLMGATCCHD
jgi:ligand-binding SRPBCC domain-containing protein